MCFTKQEAPSQDIDLPVLPRPAGSPPIVSDLSPSTTKETLPFKGNLKDMAATIKTRRAEKDLVKKYKTPLTDTNVNNFIDRQNVDEAMSPAKYGRTAKLGAWMDGVRGEEGK